MMSTVSEDAGPAGNDFRHYARIVWRRKLILAVVLAAAVGAAAVHAFSQQSLYEAQSKIVIGQGNSLFQAQNANSVQPFTATMSDLLASDVVAQRVIDNLGLNETPSSLLKKLSVSINPQTAVIKVSEVDRSPRLAQRINAEFGTVFAELIKERFGANNGLPAGVGTPTPITAIVFDPAHVVPGRVSPKPVLDIAIAVVLGIVLGLVALFSWDRLDRSLPQRGDVESAFGVPLIGQIPVRPRSQAETLWDRRSEGSGAYRALSQSLPFLAVTRPLRRLLVASAISGEGKEAVIANLAAAIASSGAKTLVVEGDLRHPLLDALLDATDRGGSPGLSSVLIGEASLNDAISPITAPRVLGGGQFDLLPCGVAPPNPDALLSTARAAEAIQTLAGSYDYVLVDAPPLLEADDALALAPLVDGLVVVARRKRTLADEALKLQGFRERTGVHVVGVVLTDSGRVAGDAARRVGKEATRRQRRAAEPGRADGDDPAAALESAVSAPAEDSPPARSRPFARLGVASRVFLLSAGGPAREYDTSASPPNDGEPSPSLRTSSVDETEAALVTTPEEDESASPPIRPKQARSPKHSRD